MQKTILITGATDGIGLETATKLRALDHNLLLHGRNATKLAQVKILLSESTGKGELKTYLADLSSLAQVKSLAESVIDSNASLDVLINNAGVFKATESITADNLDVRFVVNTIAPYALTKYLLPLLDSSSRVINVSSAAQAPVDINALLGVTSELDDMETYAQSKLAITMWSRTMAKAMVVAHGIDGPAVIAVNPGSMLSSKMVKEAFGVDGRDLDIGADILTRAALSDEFASASGKYFDNDSQQFAQPHRDAHNEKLSAEVVGAIESVIADKNIERE